MKLNYELKQSLLLTEEVIDVILSQKSSSGELNALFLYMVVLDHIAKEHSSFCTSDDYLRLVVSTVVSLRFWTKAMRLFAFYKINDRL